MREYNKRILLSRVFGVVVFILLLLTSHSWKDDSFLSLFLESLGLILITVCTLGRVWAYMYVCGRKKKHLVTEGPYSLSRNPLYLFSAMGALGLGLASQNILIIFIFLVSYLVFYPIFIRKEERDLEMLHGSAYLEYKQKVPRFIPSSMKIEGSDVYEVHVTRFRSVFYDGMWFFWIFILMNLIAHLQTKGWIPVYLRLP